MPVFGAATATHEWLRTIEKILLQGERVAPRGKQTLEIPQHTATIDMRWPVVTVPERKISYAFLAAEALFIMRGQERVDQIAKWNKRIAEFSDDGEIFFGAYGPRFVEQIPYAVDRLATDTESRQAVINLWRVRPPGHVTRDVPCTLSLLFQLRRRRRASASENPTTRWHLDCHVYMRSSDAWLGAVYDWFNESMMAMKVGRALARRRDDLSPLEPGTLYWSAASCHLYAENWDDARAIVNCARRVDPGPETPEWVLAPGADEAVERALERCRDNDPATEWKIRP